MSNERELLGEFEERARYMDRSTEKGIVNEETGSSMGIAKDGSVIFAAGTTSQYKVGHDGNVTEISLKSTEITNRKSIQTDELLINNRKLNPQIYELSDMRQLNGNPNMAIGNLTMMGTVLVKAWEPNLKKWVLIRRQVRIPMFSPMLNLADAPEEFNIDTDISEELKNMRLNKEE
jgi:hypothetical protein